MHLDVNLSMSKHSPPLIGIYISPKSLMYSDTSFAC